MPPLGQTTLTERTELPRAVCPGCEAPTVLFSVAVIGGKLVTGTDCVELEPRSHFGWATCSACPWRGFPEFAVEAPCAN